MQEANKNKQNIINRCYLGWKGRSENVSFSDVIIVYTENPKESTKQLQKIISEFSKVKG